MEEIKPRRLTKKPPGSGSGSGSSDNYANWTSNNSLSRTPSAPTGPYRPSHGHNRTTTSPNPAAYASSNSSLSEHQISGPSPVLAGSSDSAGHAGNRSSSSRPLSEKTSQELIGAPFDGSGILNHITSIDSSSQPTSYQKPRRPPPSPLSQSTAPRLMSPALRQSASFSAMNEKTSPRVGENVLISPKRYSDESKEPKNGMIRKKSGFSTLMNQMGLGSRGGVKISAPENPVHVTHVGYDQDTGQFTVSWIPTCSCRL
jgi:p21-activated kinase 1